MAIANRQDATMLLMEQFTKRLRWIPSLERERLTGALEEAANEFRRYSKRRCRRAKEMAAIFDLYSHLLYADCVANSSPRSTKALLRRPLKIIGAICRAICGATTDNYQRTCGDLRTLGQRLLFHLDDSVQGQTPAGTFYSGRG
ncbi:hypothetical protein KCP74_10295 [Salmonella enterica subsp. enterica]|nr:hypothetical protein KCP74_10295 [Salmonella enterica subsp. enterica]